MASEVQICNLALGHCGVSTPIASLDEASKEAQACKLFFEQERDTVLRDFPWPFATRIAALALVEEAPNSEWAFSYRYPTDCLRLRRVLNPAGRNDSRQSRLSYRLANDTQGTLILTDEAEASIEYTVRISNAGLFSPDFVSALALRLAAMIAPQLTGGDPFKLGERALRLYILAMGTAQASALNEEQADDAPDAEYIRARE